MIKEGDWVKIYFNERKWFVVRAIKGKELHTDEGIINLSDVLKAEYGGSVRTHLGVEALISKPSLEDIVFRAFRRKTQVIYLKDIASIIVRAGIGPGSRVVEAGTGSGVLTAFLAFYVRPNGEVYTYDISYGHQKIAKKNLRGLSLNINVHFIIGDVRKTIHQKEVDAVILDLPDPWNAVENVASSLRSGGRFVCFLPTYNQVEKAVEAIREAGFIHVESVELLERRIKAKRGETRPEFLMRGHTGFLVFSTKP